MYDLKKIMIIVLLVVFKTAHANEEITLNCNVTVLVNGNPNEKITRNIIVEVSQIGSDLFIISDDEFIGSVSTKRSNNTLKISNLSDANKWSISVANNHPKGLFENMITINRNTGKFSQYGVLNGFTMSSNGVCQKVNTNKRLF